MPLPIICGVAAVSATINARKNISDANTTLKRAITIKDEAIENYKLQDSVTSLAVDELGNDELEICVYFLEYLNVIRSIQRMPEYSNLFQGCLNIPLYDIEELENISAGAIYLIGGMGGITIEAPRLFAAFSKAKNEVMDLGAACRLKDDSTRIGDSIKYPTLDSLGINSGNLDKRELSVGTTLLVASVAGAGFLAGGLALNIIKTGLSKMSDEAYYQAMKIERQVEVVNRFLSELHTYSRRYSELLARVKKSFDDEFAKLKCSVIDNSKNNWNDFTKEEKINVYNCFLLVGMLFMMCKVPLVSDREHRADSINSINRKGIDKCMDDVEKALATINYSCKEF